MRSAGAGSLRSGDALMFRGIWLPPNTEEARNGWMMDHDFIEQTHLTENNRTSRALRFACFDTHEEYGMDDIDSQARSSEESDRPHVTHRYGADG